MVTQNNMGKIASLSLLLFVLILFYPVSSHAQFKGVGDIFTAGEAGLNDTEILLKEYLRPFGSGFGASMNAAWTDRASTHSLLGFHVKVSVSAAMVPSSNRSFDINELNLTTLQLEDPTASSIAPTFSGSSDPGPRLTYQVEDVELANFRMPEGIGLRVVPAPMIQAGVGLIRDTDVMIRFIPPVSNSDFGEISLYGLGVKHEINQWIPGGRFFPLTFSVTAGYTSFKSSASLSAEPSNYANATDPNNYGDASSPTWENQEIALSTNAFSMNLLVGRSFPILSVYAGVGFERSSTSIEVSGNYPYYIHLPDHPVHDRQLMALSDPLDISIDGANKVRALAGLRISLPLLTFNIDYTVSEYSIVSAGLGISFR
ncbi:hypothetical protein QLX67_03580 [Balneolaceae bacterium ANBcel3]|nr:hypothetical protein [Balneolaceae bacterium ANBcel3]